jgi:hypothetical protein
MSREIIIPWAKANLIKKPEFVSAFRNYGISINYIGDAEKAIDTLVKVKYPIVLIDLEQTTQGDIGMPEEIERLICGPQNNSWKIGDYVLKKVFSKKSKNKDSIVIVTGKYDPFEDVSFMGLEPHLKELGTHCYYHLDNGISGLVDIVKKLI